MAGDGGVHQRCCAIVVRLVDLPTLKQQRDHSQPLVAAPISAMTSLLQVGIWAALHQVGYAQPWMGETSSFGSRASGRALDALSGVSIGGVITIDNKHGRTGSARSPLSPSPYGPLAIIVSLGDVGNGGPSRDCLQ